ncbi:MAG: protein-disulfide reductase DsbD domain-containing protein, partial [Burkholderiaceae bacterium]
MGPVQWPTPKKFLIGTLANYGYENSLLLLQDVSMPDDLVTDSVRIDVNVAWLICKDVCIPGNKTLSVRMPVSEDSEVSRSSSSESIDRVRKNNPKED